MTGPLNNITEDEAELYDRQIRLWGLDAQKRLRGSSILIAGVGGLGAEITKNLVLSGIKSLTLLDHRPVNELDTFSNFLIPHDSIGQNIAEASRERTQVLNPMVEVIVDQEDISEKPDEFFSKFDVVFLSRTSKDLMVKINGVCHQHNVNFYAGDVYGTFGYMFCDLQSHKFVEEVKEKSTVKVDGEDKVVEETKMKPEVADFVSLADALEVDWHSDKYKKLLPKIAPSHFVMLCLLEFYDIHKRNPLPSQRSEDEVELLTIKNSLLDKLGIPQQKINQEFAGYVFGEVSPVCAIMGGVVGQEIIKAVSQKHTPLNNFFYFNSLEGAGVMETIGYA